MSVVHGKIWASVPEIKNVLDKLLEVGDTCPGCGLKSYGYWLTIKDPEGSIVVSTDWILSCVKCDWTKDITDLDIYFGPLPEGK